MKTIPFFILAISFLLSCKGQESFEDIIIEGQVANVPDGRIYLTEAHYWDIPLDSTIITNGHFVFKVKADSLFVPYMAGISFPDTSARRKVGCLFFRNYMFGADSMKWSGTSFYLEKGVTRIKGDNNKKPYLRVFAGKETDVMLKHQRTDFGFLGSVDSLKRIQRIAFFKKEIQQYPFSYFLLQSIYDSRDQYSEKEIKEIVALFNANVRQSKLGDQFTIYLANRPDPNTPYPNLSLLNSMNERHSIIDKTAKLNMLVFWASWCGPCRMEIPLLKEIENEYKGKGLNLVSISVDKDKSAWEKAMSQEKMAWPQYLVDEDKIELVRTQYNFSGIPFVLFVDSAGYEINKFTGYDKEQKKNYEALINKYVQ